MAIKNFIHEDFLLQSPFASRLYHDYAKDLPIIDYHNHLSPKKIAEDFQFANITQVWLNGDHYKWRAMRTLGIDEKYITGNAPDQVKFIKWGETVPYTVRNPLYHWTHLELKRYFNIDQLLDQNNAQKIYDTCSEQLQLPSHSTMGLLEQMKVEVVCTTDDPLDSLEYHNKLKQNSYADLLSALELRINYFHKNGCRLADHGLDYLPLYNHDGLDVSKIFKRLINRDTLNFNEVAYFKSEVLKFLAKCYHKKGWVQQFHLGALRNNNQRMLQQLGPDTGFDSIGDFSQAVSLSKFLDYLDKTDELAKTIIYNLNPADNEIIASMVGNFNDGSIKGKVQFGSAWWFLDQKDGMEKQLNTLSNIGLLSCFIGMLTDSRSFLSFPRHEYFRRVLCNLIGKDVANGELPEDENWLGKIVSDICYHNAKAYFPF
ncbi:glucuronate isomerase [uncultured Eudoraea sp.]|uniref:glucuronate isomerase n=1 Tax=uncultured Eudoraea sp. TaxID=1035614 RepID=UPI002621163D|nr:glucuronate isomerase [uncultured Eudoraea sp.]